MAVITDEQRKSMENNPRYRELCITAVQNYAGVISENDGSAPPGDPALTQVEWAKQRIIGKDIMLHPTTQNYAEWITQFTFNLNKADIWQGAEDNTIDFMIEFNVFSALAEKIYGQRMQQVQF